MALVSALALTVTGIALASLSPPQLAALAPRRWRERRGEALEAGPPTATADQAARSTAAAPSGNDDGPPVDAPAGPRLPRRPRTRQRG